MLMASRNRRRAVGTLAGRGLLGWLIGRVWPAHPPLLRTLLNAAAFGVLMAFFMARLEGRP